MFLILLKEKVYEKAMIVAPDFVTITTTQFMNFATKEPEKQLTVVREIKRNHEEGYHVPHDIYKQFRDGLLRMHRKNLPKEFLDQLITSQSEPSRREHYPFLVDGYKKFLGKKKIIWFNPPSGEWQHDELIVKVNPEIGLEWDGQKYAIKLYCNKSDTLNKRRAEFIVHLVSLAIPDLLTDGICPMILNVRKGKTFTAGKSDNDQTTLLQSIASAFITMYRGL